jgi:hypothetical protein
VACKELKIDPNTCAMPKTNKADDNMSAQMKMDSFVQRTQKWTRDGLKEYITQFVVETEQVH